MFRMTGCLFVICVLVASAAEPVYKWVGEDGSVHYSDQPPPQGYESEQLILESKQSDQEIRKSQEKLAMIQSRMKRDKDRRSEVRELKRQQKETLKAERVDNLRRCVSAREQLHNLELHLPVFYIDENGDWIFLDDNERTEYIDYYNHEINSYCD